jgi:multidrug efflux pump subunit AcrB
MKIRLLLAVFLAALAAALSGAQAEKSSELNDVMEKMGKSWRKARNQAADAAKSAEAIEGFIALKQGMEAALKLEPERKAMLPSGEQAKFMADYQAEMKKQIGKVDEIIALLKAKKNKEAAAMITTMGEDQTAAHKQFKVPKEKKKESK